MRSDVVCFECMAPVAVMHESTTADAFALLVRGYKLCNTRKGVRERRDLVTKIDEQVASPDVPIVAADGHGRGQGVSIAAQLVVRYETPVAKRPQQFVDSSRIGLAVDVDVDRVVQPVCLLGKAAREGMSGLLAGLGEQVEVDACHSDQGRAPQRSSSSCDSIGTGRPVAPFLAPDFQAVPAISR